MEVTSHLRFPITEASQPVAARFAARDLAERAGFSEGDTYRAGLVATELSTNLAKHAQGGELLLRITEVEPAGEIELLSIDAGPGMADVSRSLEDGHSTAGSPGTGLGAIRRLSDDFDIHSTTGRGTVVFVRLRANRAARRGRAQFVVGGVSVALAGEQLCGDGWGIQPRANGLVALVVDGIGDGPPAAEAAAAVSSAFASQMFATPAAALGAIHEAVRHTRGAAAAISEIRQDQGILKFAGVGNISAAICGNGAMRQTVSHNGTLGHEARYFRDYVYPWSAGSLLVMHSDGLKTQWSLDAYPGVKSRHPAVVASVLYRDYSRKRDDVTVVVAREAS
jgi:anti-sigma regulatory factor (Ser/Thr protein kinase)